MKMKLTAMLAFIVIGLAGCTAADNGNAGGTRNANAGNTNTTNTGNRAAGGDTTNSNQNVVNANYNASTETGGTKEGCKCSAAGMKCSTKPGEKGCCGGKDGACSSMVDGKASCCADKGSAGDSCCSAAGKMAMDGDKKMDNMPACGADKKPATAPAKKS